MASRAGGAPAHGDRLPLAGSAGARHLGDGTDVRAGAPAAGHRSGARPRPDRAALHLRNRRADRRTTPCVLGVVPLGHRTVRGDPALRRPLPGALERAVPPAGARPHCHGRLPVDGGRPRRCALRRPVALARPCPGRGPGRPADRSCRCAQASEPPRRRGRRPRLRRGAPLARGTRVRSRDRARAPRPPSLEGPRARRDPGVRTRPGPTGSGLGSAGRRPEARPLLRPRLRALAGADGPAARVLLERAARAVGPGRRAPGRAARAARRDRGAARGLARRLSRREGLLHHERRSRRDTFWRLLMPAWPAYLLLFASIPLLVPTLARRLGERMQRSADRERLAPLDRRGRRRHGRQFPRSRSPRRRRSGRSRPRRSSRTSRAGTSSRRSTSGVGAPRRARPRPAGA